MQKFNYDEKCFTIKRNRIAKFYKIHNFIKKYSAKEITSKISKVNNSFEKILEIGSHAGELKDELLKKKLCSHIITTDISIQMLKIFSNSYKAVVSSENLPFKNESFAAVCSCLYFNQTKDMETIFLNIKNLLQNKGFFIFSVFGTQTLTELRDALIRTDSQIYKGVFPRIHNFIDLEELGNLLLKLGFINPVVEKEIITVHYSSINKLLKDLRGMGETNLFSGRKKTFERKNFFIELEKNYQINNLSTSNIIYNATFEIITAFCWK